MSNIDDNPEAVLTAVKPALPLKYNVEVQFWPLIGVSKFMPDVAGFFLEGW